LLGFIYYLDVFPEFDDMAIFLGVCYIPLWRFMLRYSMHV